MINLTREFFKDSVEECKKSYICRVPNSKTKPVTKIGNKAFYDWEACEYVILPPTVQEIAADAFYWDRIKYIVTDAKLPKEYKGTVLPYNQFSLAIVEMFEQLHMMKEDLNISAEDIDIKREEINTKINNSLKSIGAKEKDFTQKEKDLNKILSELKQVVAQDEMLSDGILKQIESETHEQIAKVLKSLEKYEDKVIEHVTKINGAATSGSDLIKKTYLETQEKISGLVNKLIKEFTDFLEDKRNETNDLTKNLDKIFDNISAREAEIADNIANLAAEKVQEKSAYKNLNIFINTILSKKMPKKIVHKNFEEVLKVLSMHLHPLLVGPAGCGKNVMLEQVAEALDLKFHYVNDVTEEHKVMGFVDANGRFQETQFFKAFTEGGLMMIDEIDNSHPSALLAINAALGTGYNQYLAFPDGQLYPCHEDFYCAAAANTYGTGADMIYCGRSALDGASLNRFVPIFIDYDRDLEAALVSDQNMLPLYWAVREIIQKNKIRHVISTRNIVNADKMISSKMFDESQIFDMTLIQSLSEDDLRIILNDLSNYNDDHMTNAFVKHLKYSRNISRDEYRENNSNPSSYEEEPWTYY